MFATAIRPAPLATRAPVLAWALASATLLLGLEQQLFTTPLDCDVSWLLTVGEKMLDGARLYRDIFEVNPPASVLLYLPSIVLARETGLSPETMTVALVFAGGLLSLVAAGRISGERSPTIATVAAFALFVLPGGCFAQREHCALLFALPALAALARVAEGGRASLGAGACAGLMVAIKPHFALVVLPLAAVAWHRRGTVRPLCGGLLAALGVVGMYAVAIAVIWPEYADALPLLRATYLPLHEQWTKLLATILPVPLGLAGLTFWLRGRADSDRSGAITLACLLGMAGFAGAALVQAKGYANHAFPAVALGVLAVAFAARAAEPGRGRLAAVAAALLAMIQWHGAATIVPRPGLVEAVERVAPPHPRVAALSTDLDVGHPLTRMVGGEWVGRRAALFVWGGVKWRGDASLDHYARKDIAIWVQDVTRGRPDVILVDDAPKSADLRREPLVRALLARYRPSARTGGVTIWTRAATMPSPSHSPASPG